ncbi:Uncharacterised protein [uncultured Clostridium sp.]|nr:Uncharacterised protein [uncultured Clostridium sp.]
MGKKLKIGSGGLSLEADLADAFFIMSEPLGKESEIGKLNVNIEESTKLYDVMGYTTDIGTLALIFQNKTFRSSSLSNTKLNDTMEKQRVGVSQFASSRFITCFTHTCQESVPFWMNYGKDVREEKVLLQFRNFANDFTKYVRTDFAKVKDNKFCFFNTPEYSETINKRLIDDVSKYDLRACIDSISLFDVEYVKPESPVFTEDNSGKANIDFGLITGQDKAVVKMQGYNPTVLGKQKSNPWEYEKETRILSTLSNSTFKEWDYIDLQLHEEMFRGLRIVLSPWDEGKLKNKVEEIIHSSDLSFDIMNSITIVDSFLKGTLNF